MPRRCSAGKAGVASGPGLTMEFRLLGPLEVVAEGRVVPLDAPKPRALLAILLLHANEPVSRDRLIEELWAGRPPSSAAKILQTYVSQLRRALGRDVIRTVPSAYELRADAGSFDLLRFEQLVGEARAAGPAEANGMLREALSLWRGPPLAEFAYEPWAQPEIDRLEELRLEALQERIETRSRPRRECRARRRARAARRPAPAPGGPSRPAHARALPLGKAGGRTRGVSRCEARARGDARDRADARAPAARALDPRPGSGARSRHAPSRRQTAPAQPGPSLESRSSSFVGRTRELREIRALLRREDVRLLTLTGAAGSGKTRLALEVTGAFEGKATGAVLVELGRITDARLVARAIAGELGVKERPGHSAREALLEYLREQAGAAAARQLRARAGRGAARARAARRRTRREGARHEPCSSRGAGGTGLPGAGARAAGSVAASLACRAAPDRGDPAVRRSSSRGPARLRAHRDERRVGRRALRSPRRASARARARRGALQPALARARCSSVSTRGSISCGRRRAQG